MDKEFVTYEVALALKELGIYIPPPCYSVYRKYNNVGAVLLINAESMETIDLVAPLKQQVFRWFREKHEWYANLSSWLHEEEIGTYHDFEIYGANQYAHGSVPFKTYEEAENACIDKLIEISKEQQ